MTGFADLHTHSTHSDGTTSIAQNVEAAIDAGLSVLGITDHDTVAGWDEAVQAAAGRISILRGAEFSTQLGGKGVHLLAYGFDPTHPAIQPYIAPEDPEARARQFVINLRAGGYDITFEQVRAHADGTSVGRPHIARALIDAGHYTGVDEAFNGALHKKGEFYVDKPAPDTVDAIRDVLCAGGVPVVAHFLSDMRTPRDFDLSDLDALVEAGLMGVEVEHREHETQTRETLRSYASDHNLIITGSSDFHGANKPNQLGENTTTRAAVEAILAKSFLPLG